MDLLQYQEQCRKTDFTPTQGDAALAVPILGLGGEAGTLMTEYKKFLREGEAHRLFDERIAEELGDALWYISTIATKCGLDLNDVAEKNLKKCRSRWDVREDRQQQLALQHHFYDSDFPQGEQLPRQLHLVIRPLAHESGNRTVVEWDGTAIGAALTDNSYVADGYRFHDSFHFAYAATLGWSPIARSILGRQRRSDPDCDEIEDGGRAKVIEEGISALVFAYARDHAFLDGVDQVDYELLRTIRAMTAHLEVRDKTEGEWEMAILAGYSVWRQVAKYEGGILNIDLQRRSIEYRRK